MIKLLKCHLKGKTCMDSILIILKKKIAQGLHLPLYWDYFLYHLYIQQISGERLQEHWSSCFYKFRNFKNIQQNLQLHLNIHRVPICMFVYDCVSSRSLLQQAKVLSSLHKEFLFFSCQMSVNQTVQTGPDCLQHMFNK